MTSGSLETQIDLPIVQLIAINNITLAQLFLKIKKSITK